MTYYVRPPYKMPMLRQNQTEKRNQKSSEHFGNSTGTASVLRPQVGGMQNESVSRTGTDHVTPLLETLPWLLGALQGTFRFRTVAIKPLMEPGLYPHRSPPLQFLTPWFLFLFSSAFSPVRSHHSPFWQGKTALFVIPSIE